MLLRARIARNVWMPAQRRWKKQRAATGAKRCAPSFNSHQPHPSYRHRVNCRETRDGNENAYLRCAARPAARGRGGTKTNVTDARALSARLKIRRRPRNRPWLR